MEKTSLKKENLTFAQGLWVKSKSTGVEGLLCEKAKKNEWVVQFGSIKMTVKEKDLILLGKDKNLSPSVSVELASELVGNSLVFEKSPQKPVFELRLLGMYAEEAIKELERQIDLCVLNNFTHFSVIHGKGNGVLQQAVKDYLSHCPSVEDFSFAHPDDGGAGKTYVTLKG